MIEEEFKKFGASCNELAKELMKLFKIKEMVEWLANKLDKVKGE